MQLSSIPKGDKLLKSFKWRMGKVQFRVIQLLMNKKNEAEND